MVLQSIVTELWKDSNQNRVSCVRLASRDVLFPYSNPKPERIAQCRHNVMLPQDGSMEHVGVPNYKEL
jgi:hypothetical protein